MMHRRPAGVALVLVLGVALLILLLAGATARLTQGRGQSRDLGLDSQRALYLAEAGIEYVRAAVLHRAQEVVSSTNPPGIRMPTLTYLDILDDLGVVGDTNKGFVLGPIAVKGPDNKVLGHFRVTVGLVLDAVGSRDLDVKQVASEEMPAGLGWLPILSLESTGLTGPDPANPQAARRILAVMRPLPPAVESQARLPDRSLLGSPNSVADDVPLEALHPYLPRYGVPSFEISDYVDMGTPDPHLWLLDQSERAAPPFPPTSSLPGQSPEAWWFIPVEDTP